MECNYPRFLSSFNDLKLFIYPHLHTHIQTQRESCLEDFNLAAAPGCWRWEKGDYNWKNSSPSWATSKLRTARSKGKRNTRDVSGWSMTSEHSTWSGGGEQPEVVEVGRDVGAEASGVVSSSDKKQTFVKLGDKKLIALKAVTRNRSLSSAEATNRHLSSCVLVIVKPRDKIPTLVKLRVGTCQTWWQKSDICQAVCLYLSNLVTKARHWSRDSQDDQRVHRQVPARASAGRGVYQHTLHTARRKCAHAGKLLQGG